jgi:DNA (cytosine-5)-methyltransferase 1
MFNNGGNMKALTLFANIGIDEYYLKSIGITVTVANELLKERADLYSMIYPNVNMVCGDITSKKIYTEVLKASKDIDLIIATPPCQGMSIAHAKRAGKNDIRNSLIKKVVDFINDLEPNHILIENVRGMAKTYILDNGVPINIMEYIKQNIPSSYCIKSKVVNAADHGTPQNRHRLITLISKSPDWSFPIPIVPASTVREAIGHLPSIESGQKTNIPWHFGRAHNDWHIKWMKHTPTGKSAYDNKIWAPCVIDKNTGIPRLIKGFRTTYKRIEWDKPAPTIGMTNGSINSQNNVHPGKELKDGTYSDARVLSVRELLNLCGLPENCYDVYEGQIKESLMRHVIGECFPPKMCLEIMKTNPDIKKNLTSLP